MASTEAVLAFSLENAKKSLKRDGFCCLRDPAVGRHIQEMERKDFPIASLYGLQFCRLNVLGDKRIRDVVESLFSEADVCYLGMYLRYGYHKGYDSHAYRFQMADKDAGLSVLMVQLWTKSSRANYYRGSHLLELPTTRMQNELYATADADLVCPAQDISFEDGGLAFFDARSLFKIKNNSALTFAFTTKAVLENKEYPWYKMLLPNTQEMVEEVSKMERISPKIRVNFAFNTSTLPQALEQSGRHSPEKSESRREEQPEGAGEWTQDTRPLEETR